MSEKISQMQQKKRYEVLAAIVQTITIFLPQWPAEGGADRATAPGIQGRGGIQRMNLQKL